MHTVEIFLALNESGDAACSLENANEARETLENEFGGEIIRTIPVTVEAELPVVPHVVAKAHKADDAVKTAEPAMEAEAAE